MLSNVPTEVATRSKFAVTQQNYDLCTPHLCGVMHLDSRLSSSNSEKIKSCSL